MERYNNTDDHILQYLIKVRNSGLGPDPDFSAKNGPEKVRNWPLGLEFVEMPLVSLNIYYIYIYIGIFSHIRGI